MRPNIVAPVTPALLVGCLLLSGSAHASIQGISPRSGHTVTELNDGRLLVAGGEDESGLVAAIEVFDPATGTSDVIAILTSPRKRHSAVRLNDGRVLLAGGAGSNSILDTVELIDPVTGEVTVAALVSSRADHTATLLPDGSVLVAGGSNGTETLASLEIFNPAFAAFSPGGTLSSARQQHTATLLDDGRVLVVGGLNESGALATTEYWDPATGIATPGPAMVGARFGHTATRVLHGHVAVIGGSDGNGLLATGEIYCKDDLVFHLTANALQSPRIGHAAVALPDNGHLMVLGGRSADGPVGSVELLHPANYTFTVAAPLGSPRAEFGIGVAGLHVWAVGGAASGGAPQESVDAVPFGTLTTDLDDYPSNSMVTFTGSGWLPGEQVEITIQQSDGDPDIVVTSTADAEGRIVNTDFWTADDDGGVAFVATAVGSTSGRAALREFFDSHFLSSISPAFISQNSSNVVLQLFGGNFTIGLGVQVWASGPGGSGIISITSMNNSNISVTLPPWVTNVSGTYGVWVRQFIENFFCHSHFPLGFHCHSEGVTSHNSATRMLTVDGTPPVITPTISGPLGSNGWYVGNVSVSWSVSDPQSSFSTSGCSTQTVTFDTPGTSFTCSAWSAGGSNWYTVNIKRDASPPSASIFASVGTLGNNGWYVSDVTVRTSGADTTSEPVTCTAAQFQTTDTPGSSFSGSCTNQAGLTKGAGPLVIRLDKTRPVISAAATTSPNAFGWYQSNVTVAFTCADALSGVATCPANQPLSTEGTGIVSTAQVATDAAGNTSVPSNVVSVNIDKTAPLVSLSGGPGPVHGGSYYFGAVPSAPICSASDGLSGLQGSCAVAGYSTAVGSHTVIAAAVDKAGNSGSSASVSYTVLPWTFNGFYQPVDMGDVVNTVRNGSTVPIKFEVFAGFTELTDTSVVVQPLMASQTMCGGGAEDQIEFTATGGTSLRYDATEGQFVYNWRTPKMPGYCYVVTVTLTDGTFKSAKFSLR